MSKIRAARKTGLETLYGAHDANLKHIESLLGVQIRTHGDELHRRRRRRRASSASERLFDQLAGLMRGRLRARATGDVKTAAQLVVEDEHVDLARLLPARGARQSPTARAGA